MLLLCKEIFHNNRINSGAYDDAVRDFLARVQGKFHNIMIIGSINYAKTFILQPPESIFQTFFSSTNNKYTWLVQFIQKG